VRYHELPASREALLNRWDMWRYTPLLPLLDDVVSDVESAALRRLAGTTVADLAAQAIQRG